MNFHLSFSKKLVYSLFISFFILSNFSFGQGYYFPNDAHLLALSQRNDIHLSGSFNPFAEAQTVTDVQLAYSPIKHIGISSNYFQYSNFENNLSVPINTKNKSWDIAAGVYYFLPLTASGEDNWEVKEKSRFFSAENLEQRSGILFDIYVGHSQADVTNTFQEYGFNYFEYKKTYVQVGLHGTIKYFSFQVASRWGNLNYVEGLVHGPTSIQLQNPIKVIASNSEMDFSEFFVRASTGIRYGQLIFSFSRIQHTPIFTQLGVKDHIVMIGLKLDVDEFFR